MADRETSRSIDADAADWVAREDRAPLSPGEAEALAVWLEGDLRRPGALLRARAVALRSEQARALGRHYDPLAFGGAAPAPSRRSMLAWSGGLAASVAAATVVGLTLQAPKAHATERGEIRLVPLPDGSTVMLNTATRVTVKYDAAGRRVRLVEGEADFSVVTDRVRPFEVEVDGRRFTASVGGAFRVRKLGDGLIDILVRQGRVAVQVGTRTEPKSATLGPNTRLALPTAGGEDGIEPRPVSPRDVARDLAWKDGKIAFEGETVAQAAAAFARYSETRIVVEDAALAREPITGLFAANDPAGFARAVAGIFDAPVTDRPGTVVIGRSPPRQ